MKKALMVSSAVMALLFAGCFGAERVGEAFGRQAVVDSAKLRQGQQVFYEHCHHCHPSGEGGLAPALNNKLLPESLIAFQVRHGLGAMPEFGPQHIGDEDLKALTAYLIALREAAQP